LEGCYAWISEGEAHLILALDRISSLRSGSFNACRCS
jgi:hypothetical protein